MQHTTNVTIRPIQPQDDPIIADIIRQVLVEYGANCEGFAWADPELDRLSTVYTGGRAQYWVGELDGKVVGGVGFSQLQGGDDTESELQKMYLLPEARGKGIAKELMSIMLAQAQANGYSSMYLETLNSMQEANGLYQKFGFRQVATPCGDTGHGGCDTYYVRQLLGDNL